MSNLWRFRCVSTRVLQQLKVHFNFGYQTTVPGNEIRFPIRILKVEKGFLMEIPQVNTKILRIVPIVDN